MNVYYDSLKHLEDNKMNYIEHLTFSFYLGTSLFVSSIKAFIHSFIPCYFPTSTTDLTNSLDELIHKNK